MIIGAESILVGITHVRSRYITKDELPSSTTLYEQLDVEEELNVAVATLEFKYPAATAIAFTVVVLDTENAPLYTCEDVVG